MGERIEEITGILNGTTNYILTKMDKEGETFENALKEAQNLGYAERNPEADVGRPRYLPQDRHLNFYGNWKDC